MPQMCIVQVRVTFNSNTNADPMIIAGQNAFATSFIHIPHNPPRTVWGSVMTRATSAVDEIKMCSDANCSRQAQLVAVPTGSSGFSSWRKGVLGSSCQLLSQNFRMSGYATENNKND
jgi:hypothetical protein